MVPGIFRGATVWTRGAVRAALTLHPTLPSPDTEDISNDMQKALQLIRISPSGLPASEIGDLPPIATETGADFAAFFRTVGFQPPWVGYFALVGEKCVGVCAFKGPPMENRVEIAYFTFPEHEGEGYATGMARSLVDIGQKTDPQLIIAAQTLPQEGASTAILQKLGFRLVGTVDHPEDGEVWEWRYEKRA